MRKKGKNIDKYTKFILTVIAVGIIGLNYQLIFKGNIISDANAESNYLYKWPSDALRVIIVNK